MKKYLFITLLIAISNIMLAQNNANQKWKDPVRKGLKFNLTESGSSYMKIGARAQFKMRSFSTNPGTVDPNGKRVSNYSDFSLRRMRMNMLINYENKFIFFSHFGLTNQPLNAMKQGMVFHDLFGKLTIVDKNLYLGAGLHGWNGLSRMSNLSSGSMMTLDHPVYNFPGVNQDNQMNRQMGIFIHGQLNKFDYQFSINSPILSNSALKTDAQIIAANNGLNAYHRYSNSYAYKGYASYSFLNIEKVGATPYKAMTYLGKKGKILNLGVGFQYRSGAIGVLESGEVNVSNRLTSSVDLFLDLPLKNESAVTLYLAYYNYKLGKNYLRASGNMSGVLKKDDTAFPVGGANRQFIYGTGSILYSSFGYVIPSENESKWQPFYSLSYKNLDGLNDTSIQHDFGLNYYQIGNKIKWTVQYSTRPLFDNNKNYSSTKGEIMLQLQFNI